MSVCPPVVVFFASLPKQMTQVFLGKLVDLDSIWATSNPHMNVKSFSLLFLYSGFSKFETFAVGNVVL